MSGSSAVGVRLRVGGPVRLAEVAHQYLVEGLGALRVQVLVADYRISGLWPVLGEAGEPGVSLVDASAASRCFASQRVLLEEGPQAACRALVPLTLWGDRLGVLVVELPGAPDEPVLAEVGWVADEVAVALVAADRFTDRYRQARRRQRMTMAAEMQWDMLPGRALRGPNFALAGQLEPAYEVCGDHFDWSVTDDRLLVSVLNGQGRGMDATLLTAVAVNAMRNARRSGGNLVEQAELASDAVFAMHGGRLHLATLLLELDLGSGRARVIDAGSPRAVLMRDGQALPIELEHQLPLGMFADARYAPQHIELRPGDRLLVVSDGVHAATPGGRSSFGDRRLMPALRATRLQPAPEAVASLMRSFHDYHEGENLEDDAVIVCLDLSSTPQRSSAS